MASFLFQGQNGVELQYKEQRRIQPGVTTRFQLELSEVRPISGFPVSRASSPWRDGCAGKEKGKRICSQGIIGRGRRKRRSPSDELNLKEVWSPNGPIAL